MSCERLFVEDAGRWLDENRTDVVSSYFLGRHVIHVRDPDAIQQIARSAGDFEDPGAGAPGSPPGPLRALLGGSLAALRGDAHAREREAMSAPFEASYVEAHVPFVAGAAADLARALAQSHGYARDVGELVRRAALDTVGAVGFGAGFGALEAAMGRDVYLGSAGPPDRLMGAWLDLTRAARALARAPAWLAWLLPAARRLRAAAAELRGTAEEMIRQRASQGGFQRGADESPAEGVDEARDVLSHLLANRFRYGLSADQIRDEVMGLLVGGVDTTAATLCACLAALCERPGLQRGIRDEVLRALDGRGVAELTGADLRACTLLQATWKEALRLYPAAVAAGRTATRDTEVCGYHIPRGALLGVSFWELHRNPALWPRALEFLPERWLAEYQAELGPTRRDAFMPFSVGPRACLGAPLADVEGPALLAGILAAMRLEPAPGWRPDYVQGLSLESATGFRMVTHEWTF